MNIEREMAAKAVETLLTYIGEDVGRPGLVDTPARFVKALEEMTAGYKQDPIEILSAQFDFKTSEMIVLSGLKFTSLCEHHLLPFYGTAALGYIPDDKAARPCVVGISKLARLLNCYAKRLQLQERMTKEIGDAMDQRLTTLGVGVSITAKHMCMECRGVNQAGFFTTNYFTGAILKEASARTEFLSQVHSRFNF